MITRGRNPNYRPPAEAAIARNGSDKRLVHGTTIEWGGWGSASVMPPSEVPMAATTLTPEEIAAIKRKADTTTVDLGRAEAVKWAMMNGCETLSKVQEAVSAQYRPTQVSIYRAALVELWGGATPYPTECKQ